MTVTSLSINIISTSLPAGKPFFPALDFPQIPCFSLLKTSPKEIYGQNDKGKGLLCSYFMKTSVFWLSEEISTNAFQLQNLFQSYQENS
jgi:hypothetical protein